MDVWTQWAVKSLSFAAPDHLTSRWRISQAVHSITIYLPLDIHMSCCNDKCTTGWQAIIQTPPVWCAEGKLCICLYLLCRFFPPVSLPHRLHCFCLSLSLSSASFILHKVSHLLQLSTSRFTSNLISTLSFLLSKAPSILLSYPCSFISDFSLFADTGAPLRSSLPAGRCGCGFSSGLGVTVTLKQHRVLLSLFKNPPKNNLPLFPLALSVFQRGGI